MSNSTASNAAPYEVENCRGALKVFSDGTIYRSDAPLASAPISDDGSVVWEDVIYDNLHNLHLRLYTPKSTLPPPTKLPVVVYIHGGGFCIGTRTWPNFHNYCFRLSGQLPAIVVAPDYRLAPENRIPDAIDDCFNALRWVRDRLEVEAADLGKIFVVGDSAGGNIAHNLAVRLDRGREELKIRGYALMAPFFGGTQRTKSELDGPKDAFLNLDQIDRFWRLSIPEGENSDHPLVNPFGPRSPSLNGISISPLLVVLGSNDLLRDRAIQYANRLRELGNEVDYVEFPAQEHNFFTFYPDSSASKELMILLKSFISKNSL